MPHREEITPQDVLAHLAQAAKPVSLREIAAALELRHPARRQLQKIIGKLKRKGEIEEVYNGKFALAGAQKAKTAAPALRSGDLKVAATQPLPRDPNLITGRIVTHRDGYGFVVPDRPVPGMDGDLFIGRESIGDAMHGDVVAARIERRRPDSRAEGRVMRIMRRAHPTVVGVFHYGSRGNTVAPFDTRLLQEIIIPPGEELTLELRERSVAAGGSSPRRIPQMPELDGAVVDVELTRFPRGGIAPAGRVLKILGRPGEMGIDIEIIIRKHHLPHEFPPETMAAAVATPQQVSAQDREGREDFRHLPIVTIDGETAKDFDDAVHVRRLSNGCYELQVHIADVAHYVARGSALDREARLRGTSVYFPNRAVPMLPEELSNGICSLNPKVDRLVMSAVMEMDARGAVLAARFAQGVIRSAERMTYTNVNKVLEGDAEMTARYAPLAEHFRLMRELAMILNARRNGRGSIDFDLPERVIEFDEMGRMASIVRSERNIANRLIEEFMLTANEAVAAYLENRALASLHRVHEKPDPKRVLEFEELARAFGYSLGVENLSERVITVKHGHTPAPAKRQRGRHSDGRGGQGRTRPMTVSLPGALELNIRPQHYQRLTQKIAGKPEERILSYLMLRSLKQARYAAEALGHFALAADAYTHFTSPIRRYPDLIVHRVLKWALANPSSAESVPPPVSQHKKPGPAPKGAQATGGPYRVVELEEIASESSEAERRADGAERELMDWKTAQYMEQHLGTEYEALIISVLKFGFFVELMEVFVEGLVPISALEEFTGLRCFFREGDRSIVAEAKRGAGATFHLGDKVRVRADRIDPIFRRVEFALVETLKGRMM